MPYQEPLDALFLLERTWEAFECEGVCVSNCGGLPTKANGVGSGSVG